MSQKIIDHFCTVCNEGYHSCDLCKEVQEYTPWRALCDTEQHYQVYMMFQMHRDGVMNDSEVKDSLNHIGVTVEEIKTFIPAVQEILLPIMEELVVEEVVLKNETTEESTKTKRK